jgi:predicted secreted protein
MVPYSWSYEDGEGDGMRYGETVTGAGGGRWLTVGFGGVELWRRRRVSEGKAAGEAKGVQEFDLWDL